VNDRRADRTVHHHQLEQVRGPVGSEHQPAHRVVANLLDGDSIVNDVADIFVRDAVTHRRAENLHHRIVLRNRQAAAQDRPALPGRPKTDRAGSVWLARITERGPVASSFVPPEPVRRLRTHTRYRRHLTPARTAEKQRVEKLLEDARSCRR
jgi:hypothetical protein